jgi:murein L,D-transpeptidase YcbB/YkuD
LAWSSNGEFVPQADMFVNVIEQAEEYGMELDSSLVQTIRDSLLFLKDAPKPLNNRLILLKKNIDLVLTAEYFLIAPQLFQGLIDPAEEESIQWNIEPKKISYTQLLDSILYNQTTSNPFIDNNNLHPQLAALKNLLAYYRKIERNGGWPGISDHVQPISSGDTGKTVRQLVKRLLITNDLESFDTIKPVFNSILESGVKNFQKRHGLIANGIVDKLTLSFLNIPVEEKLKQILVNMERWRWIPGPVDKNYILVNIPDYTLTIFRNGSPVESMNIIVGKTGSHTVIFQGKIKYIVLNPYWNIPKSISIEEILPQVKNDKAYLQIHQIEVGRKWNFKAVNQDTINWKNVTKENFNYTFRQKPGDKNPLGRIKFLFPNQFSIYLHDTPNYTLFSETERGFSHGCIRVEKPVELADYLLGNNALAKRRKIYDLLISGKNESITMDTPISVYIVYFTVWVDQNGIFQFRNDVYGHDRKLAQRIFP